MPRFSKTYTVYIMTNKYDKVLYVGVTNNLARRVYEHKNKLLKSFTSNYNVTKLVYFENYYDIQQAIAREKQIKGWLRKKKIELIKSINPEFKNLYEQILQ
jgi:putative endonuclease